MSFQFGTNRYSRFKPPTTQAPTPTATPAPTTSPAQDYAKRQYQPGYMRPPTNPGWYGTGLGSNTPQPEPYRPPVTMPTQTPTPAATTPPPDTTVDMPSPKPIVMNKPFTYDDQFGKIYDRQLMDRLEGNDPLVKNAQA